MIDISKLCMACLSEKDENGDCPNCRKEKDIIQTSPLLPIKSVIAGRYLIAKSYKQNGEGITYMAYDMKLEKSVSVREFFPKSLCYRDVDELTVVAKPGNEAVYSQYLTSFTSLWNKLMRLKGLTALISVSEVFAANGTQYAVYDESERITLRDYLLDTKEGFISWEKARIMFMPVLSTLGTLHTSGVIHKGINPAAFIFSKDGKLKLTDFSIEPARVVTGAIQEELFDGYAPIEQYTAGGKIGPWTDIYAFCSVIYRSLIGTIPIDAKTRALNDQMMIPARFAEQLPPYVINALINGMAIEPSDRTDNIEQFRNDLSASPRAVGASAPVYNPTKPAQVAQATQPIKTAQTPVSSASSQKSNASVSQARPAVQIANNQNQRLSSYEELQNAKKSKKKNVLIAVLCVILVCLLCGIGMLIGEIIKINGSENPSENTSNESTIVSVPNFIGGYISAVIADPQYTNYFTFQTVKKNDATVMEGIIIDQSIPQNSQATIGDTIILTVSAGPKSFALQDVTGYTYEQAEAALKSQGLICQKSSMHNDGTKIGGSIAETIPAANSVVKEGDVITIIVYTSLEEETSADQNGSGGGNSVEEFLQGLNPSGNQNTNTQQQNPSYLTPSF